MNDPFISICIPTYKNVDYLQRLLQSVIIQTFKDYEIVITDNSPDNSVEQLVTEWKSKLSIRYYKNDPPYIYGKTGTLSNNHSLSGYLITKKGRTFIFSFMCNNYPGSVSTARVWMEKILKDIYLHY